VLSHRHVQLNRSLSHCVSQENHLEYHIISTLCTEEANTSFHLCLRTIHPTHGLPHTGAHNIPSLSQRGTTHPTHGLPYTGAHNIPSPSQRGTTHPTHGLHHLTQGHNVPSLSQRGTTHPSHGHTQLMGFLTPHRGTHNVPSPSQRGTTHPSHGHTQLMGSLSGRLTQSVSWRMSHAVVIINTPSQLGRHSPPGQVSHGSTRTSSWL
jgi:hypothetical protein